MEWEPEQQDLGGLGLAGICREIYRAVFRSILPYAAAGVEAALLSALLLAHVAALRGLSSLLEADDGFHLVGFLAGLLFEVVSIIVLDFFSLVCTAVYVFLIASLYCTQGDFRASRRLQRHLPRVPLTRLIPTFLFALALAYIILVFSVVALLLLHYEVGLPLQLMGAAACLAGAAYVAPVFRLACVASVLEDAVLLAAVRKSRALLAGKFWPAAAVFLTLDGCFVALQLAFARLVLGDALGLGLGIQVAAGVATFVALWVVLLLTLAAQPVIYMVCKNHHHEVVDKVHLDYIGEYERLAVDGDNSVELQPVTTEQIPETSA
ncbi:uncharacterized protein LOC119350241 [Triticum dicoccoides]|uniref:uncharacterized protein LOC119350241 n=1 Tax=Triticum dicoccoides TaxID=85692 RepID=UPI0018900AF9|nr:uncharacterized protein LOC119350241 [Triticum dicoccoides]